MTGIIVIAIIFRFLHIYFRKLQYNILIFKQLIYLHLN